MVRHRCEVALAALIIGCSPAQSQTEYSDGGAAPILLPDGEAAVQNEMLAPNYEQYLPRDTYISQWTDFQEYSPSDSGLKPQIEFSIERLSPQEQNEFNALSRAGELSPAERERFDELTTQGITVVTNGNPMPPDGGSSRRVNWWDKVPVVCEDGTELPDYCRYTKKPEVCKCP